MALLSCTTIHSHPQPPTTSHNFVTTPVTTHDQTLLLSHPQPNHAQLAIVSPPHIKTNQDLTKINHEN